MILINIFFVSYGVAQIIHELGIIGIRRELRINLGYKKFNVKSNLTYNMHLLSFFSELFHTWVQFSLEGETMMT